MGNPDNKILTSYSITDVTCHVSTIPDSITDVTCHVSTIPAMDKISVKQEVADRFD